ncbi:hypothetical protein RFI_08216 [Reticulomyxa filosa]|uniref:Uncharacterized protein n=1 Tax=Reticulomyxa filosa TaxID=46433 RepID=X6NUI3_RETFI|nr:hypothetical protein RFI_08216 [Reticulomyxa filosa]|eukprot:ETO28907.1 hypothetical protein RFI_08216 [Reticulomyxa filosa]
MPCCSCKPLDRIDNSWIEKQFEDSEFNIDIRDLVEWMEDNTDLIETVISAANSSLLSSDIDNGNGNDMKNENDDKKDNIDDGDNGNSNDDDDDDDDDDNDDGSNGGEKDRHWLNGNIATNDVMSRLGQQSFRFMIFDYWLKKWSGLMEKIGPSASHFIEMHRLRSQLANWEFHMSATIQDTFQQCLVYCLTTPSNRLHFTLQQIWNGVDLQDEQLAGFAENLCDSDDNNEAMAMAMTMTMTTNGIAEASSKNNQWYPPHEIFKRNECLIFQACVNPCSDDWIAVASSLGLREINVDHSLRFRQRSSDRKVLLDGEMNSFLHCLYRFEHVQNYIQMTVQSRDEHHPLPIVGPSRSPPTMPPPPPPALPLPSPPLSSVHPSASASASSLSRRVVTNRAKPLSAKASFHSPISPTAFRVVRQPSYLRSAQNDAVDRYHHHHHQNHHHHHDRDRDRDRVANHPFSSSSSSSPPLRSHAYSQEQQQPNQLRHPSLSNKKPKESALLPLHMSSEATGRPSFVDWNIIEEARQHTEKEEGEGNDNDRDDNDRDDNDNGNENEKKKEKEDSQDSQISHSSLKQEELLAILESVHDDKEDDSNDANASSTPQPESVDNIYSNLPQGFAPVRLHIPLWHLCAKVPSLGRQRRHLHTSYRFFSKVMSLLEDKDRYKDKDQRKSSNVNANASVNEIKSDGNNTTMASSSSEEKTETTRSTVVSTKKEQSLKHVRNYSSFLVLQSHPFLPLYVSSSNRGEIHLWHFMFEEPLATLTTYNPLFSSSTYSVRQALADDNDAALDEDATKGNDNANNNNNNNKNNNNDINDNNFMIALRFNDFGNKLAAMSRRGDMHLWHFDAPKSFYRRELQAFSTFHCHDKMGRGLAFVKGSSYITTAGDSSNNANVAVFDLLFTDPQRSLVRTYTCYEGTGATCVENCGDLGCIVTGGHTGVLHVFDPRASTSTFQWEYPNFRIWKLKYFEPTQELMVGTLEGTVSVWDMRYLPKHKIDSVNTSIANVVAKVPYPFTHALTNEWNLFSKKTFFNHPSGIGTSLGRYLVYWIGWYCKISQKAAECEIIKCSSFVCLVDSFLFSFWLICCSLHFYNEVYSCITFFHFLLSNWLLIDKLLFLLEPISMYFSRILTKKKRVALDNPFAEMAHTNV